MSIEVRNVRKSFGKNLAVNDVSLTAATGSLVALIGPSGSGKTTLLRIIAGLEAPDSGSVLHRDDDMTGKSARDRNVGFVFQHYALFRHMTVFENVAFGLRVRKWPGAMVRERVTELLKLVRLDDKAARYPSELSGGQKQRIALVRALAPKPPLLLLDEPFGALDARVRDELRHWLRRFHDEYQVTSIFVTHDQAEAFEVADQVVVMMRGRVEQAGTPAEVFEHPRNAAVMDFLGNVNVFRAQLRDGRVLFGDVEMPVRPGVVVEQSGGDADVYVRPHELMLERETPSGKGLRARVVHVNAAGSVVKVRVLAEAFGLMVNVDISPDRHRELALAVGERVVVAPKSAKMFEPDYTI